MIDDATVHLRIPAATKARWGRDSRAAGQRLTDWIVERVETHMQGKQLVVIPAELADDLIAEASAEDERGGGLSHQPGRDLIAAQCSDPRPQGKRARRR